MLLAEIKQLLAIMSMGGLLVFLLCAGALVVIDFISKL